MHIDRLLRRGLILVALATLCIGLVMLGIGSGVGAALMWACIDAAQLRGHRTLWLGVWEHNLRAQEFYRKWNFQEVGTHVFQLGEDPQTDLLMQRKICE